MLQCNAVIERHDCVRRSGPVSAISCFGMVLLYMLSNDPLVTQSLNNCLCLDPTESVVSRLSSALVQRRVHCNLTREVGV